MNTIPATALEAESLAALIREQSAAEAAAVVAQGRERAERIREAGARQVERVEHDAREEGTARGRREAAQLLAAAETECQRRYLQARERLIEESIAHASERLAGLATRPDAAIVVERLIAAGLQILPPGPVRVSMPEAYAGLLDAAALDRLGGARIEIKLQPDFPSGGGVILETPEGRLRFDNSFGARLRRLADRLRRAVAEARHIDQLAAVTRPD
ncbi:V-type ATP synthase subunit E [Candidatus Binatia bacterium]|nr:V-type ATP synthase subunit E [Candidatus Binatia bacterium]